MKKYIAIATLLAAGTAFANAESESFTFKSTTSTDILGGFGAVDFSIAKDSWLDCATWDYKTSTQMDLDSITLSMYNTWYTNNNMTTGFGIGIYEKTVTGETTTWTLVGKTDWFSHTAAAYTGDHTFTVSGDVLLSVDSTYTLAFFAGEDYLSGLEVGSTRDSMAGAKEWKAVNGPHPGASTDALAAVGLRGVATDATNSVVMYQPGDSGPKTGWTPNITLTGSAVPEPSAFGLLAGLGALALVASRRRRK